MHTALAQSLEIRNLYRRIHYNATKPAPTITRICAHGPLAGELLTLTVGCQNVVAASAVFSLRGHVGRYVEGHTFSGKPAFVWQPQPTVG